MTDYKWPPHLRRGPQTTEHPYPLEIGFQALIYTTGATFYYAFVDVTVGDYLHQIDKPYERIRDKFLAVGLSPGGWENNFRAFEAYMRYFPNPVFQNALFGMIIHWDCYIAKLGKFVEFARTYVDSPILNKNKQNDLERIGHKGIVKQISILEESTNLSFCLGPNIVSNLTEMNLVRNLGMHNQWAVDEYYLQQSQGKTIKKGSVREVTKKELELWHQAIMETIQATSTMIAAKYVSVPDFNYP